jgi:two-component system chemotaxis response regulator CheB
MVASGTIRVLIVDDSVFMCRVLESIISAEPDMEVIGQAYNGREAVAMLQGTKADVVTMDINMPHMDGLAATEVIMSTNPVPIVIVSSESREGAAPTLKALELGAVDFVAKPTSGVDLDMDSIRGELVRKLRMAAKVRVVRTAVRTKESTRFAGEFAPRPAPNTAPKAGRFPVVVIAASTGGPQALMRLVPSFPQDFPAAVLLIQHMPGTFTSQFTSQLAEAAAIKVKEAEPGEIIQPRNLYVCPGSHHLRLSPTGRITLDDGPRVNGYRPCADLAMETTASFAGAMNIGVILTGMGSDGATGAKALKAAGGHVIAQDEATSVIFGMPSEAIKAGAVDQVLPIDSIYSGIEKRVLYIFGAAKVGAL